MDFSESESKEGELFELGVKFELSQFELPWLYCIIGGYLTAFFIYYSSSSRFSAVGVIIFRLFTEAATGTAKDRAVSVYNLLFSYL